MTADELAQAGRLERDRTILLATIAALAGVVAAMAALDRYSFLWKTAIVPILFLVALLTRRHRRFVEDWGVFLGLVILFDCVRGLIFAAITHWQLPVYMQYAIDAERWLCGGHVLPVLVQQWRADLPAAEAIDRVFTIIHGSHFAFFLLVGLAIWMLRPSHFRRYAIAVVALIYLGALIYLIVPTVPPWMAVQFDALPPLLHITAGIYNTNLPTLHEAFDVNPIAAMPSLHAALPTLAVLLAAPLFKRAAPLAWLYLALVYAAIIYLGEHYLVDVLAGAALAGAVAWASRRVTPPAGARRAAFAVSPALLLALLIVGAEGVGQLTVWLRRPFVVTPAFVARELAGRTPLAHLYQGRFAFDRGDWPRARREFELAAARLESPARRRVATNWLIQAAYRQGDYQAVIAALTELDARDVGGRLLLARAYVESGQHEQGVTLLNQLVDEHPTAPEPLYWLVRAEHGQGRLSDEALRRQVARLQALEGEDDRQRFSASLLALAGQ